MKNFLYIALSLIIAFGSFPAVFAGEEPGICYYVDGVSDGNGSIESPFTDLEDARDAVRALRKNGTDAPVDRKSVV